MHLSYWEWLQVCVMGTREDRHFPLNSTMNRMIRQWSVVSGGWSMGAVSKTGAGGVEESQYRDKCTGVSIIQPIRCQDGN